MKQTDFDKSEERLVVCERCGKETKLIVKETGVCQKCNNELKRKDGGIYGDAFKINTRSQY